MTTVTVDEMIATATRTLEEASKVANKMFHLSSPKVLFDALITLLEKQGVDIKSLTIEDITSLWIGAKEIYDGALLHISSAEDISEDMAEVIPWAVEEIATEIHARIDDLMFTPPGGQPH